MLVWVRDLWLSGLCTSLLVTDCDFNLRLEVIFPFVVPVTVFLAYLIQEQVFSVASEYLYWVYSQAKSTAKEVRNVSVHVIVSAVTYTGGTGVDVKKGKDKIYLKEGVVH